MAVLGESGVPALPQITINKSQTWVPPQDGVVCIHVVGAGGSGAVGNTFYDAAGGAGAYAKIPSLAVTTAGSFTLVVGVGGAFIGKVGGQQNGNAGGNSTIAGTGITGTLTCGGGGGGIYNTQVNPAAGGAVSGSTSQGWAGYSGGGGRVGGGAVGIFATGNESAAFNGSIYNRNGAATDAAFGGLAMSGHGAICGGTTGGPHYTNDMNFRGEGDDFCGGGYGYASGAGSAQGGKGGVGAGGGPFFPSGGASYSHKGTSGAGGNGIILIQYLS